jgi:Ca-activated chloride channel family protein
MSVRSVLALGLVCVSLLAAAPSSTPIEPILWPEEQRAFYQDGPGLLLTAAERSEYAQTDDPGRTQFIANFYARSPELKAAIEARQNLASHQFMSPRDLRWKMLFLNGTPAQRTVVDCGTAFRPLEVWDYKAASAPTVADAADRYMVLYQPVTGEPFKAWDLGDGKRVLYTEQMEYWLEQWEEVRSYLGRRFDKKTCKEAELVDRATGLAGLHGVTVSSTLKGKRNVYGMRNDDGGTGFLEAPSDRLHWAHEAATGKTAAPPTALAVKGFDIDFLPTTGSRVLVHGMVQAIASSAPADKDDTHLEAGKPAGPQAHVTIEGTVETDNRVFDSFRLRYRTAFPAAGQPVALAVDRPLRPGVYVLRLRVHDDSNGAEATVAKGFEVPDHPTATAQTLAVIATPPVTDDAADRLVVHRADSLTLVPPDEDVVLGLWRTEALVTGDRIVKVNFSIDGKEPISRSTKPFTVELRLARFPTEAVVRAEGFDAAGHSVASDEVILNEPHGGLRVRVNEPPRGAKVTGNKVAARAEVTVPEERHVQQVEFLVNDKIEATLTKPPWAATVAVPAGTDTVYMTVRAQLDDGTKAEDVRFLRSPNIVEEVDVNLIELYTAVTDGANQPVKGLTAADFEVLEAGKPQKLSRFEVVENLPLTLGILIDTSGSMATSLPEAQRAASEFLQRMITRRDRCFTLTFSDHPTLRMPLTDDPSAAAASISNLQAVGATSIHDALVQSLYYFRGTRGQRALVLLSDGDDNSSQLTFDEAQEYARRSGVAIYTIGLDVSRLQVGIRHKLNHLSEVTGGRVFYVSKATELKAVYAEIESELRSRYLLAFESGTASAEGGYREVEVRVKKSGLHARTARGYYP